MAQNFIPVLLIRPPMGFGGAGRFFTAVGELKDVTNDDEVMAKSKVIDCGEAEQDESYEEAAQRKRDKHRYHERYPT